VPHLGKKEVVLQFLFSRRHFKRRWTDVRPR
jgi:hypothetical protein